MVSGLCFRHSFIYGFTSQFDRLGDYANRCNDDPVCVVEEDSFRFIEALFTTSDRLDCAGDNIRLFIAS